MAKELYPCSLHGLSMVRFIHHRDFRVNHTHMFGPAFFLSEPPSSSPKVSASRPSAFAGPSTNVQPKPPVPEKFRILVERIRHYPTGGATRTALGADLVQIDKDIYKKANVSKFAAYIDAATVAGVVTVGTNTNGEGVVSLQSPWPFTG